MMMNRWKVAACTLTAISTCRPETVNESADTKSTIG